MERGTDLCRRSLPVQRCLAVGSGWDPSSLGYLVSWSCVLKNRRYVLMRVLGVWMLYEYVRGRASWTMLIVCTDLEGQAPRYYLA